MKKFIITVCLSFFGIAALAQTQGEVTIGAHLKYGSEIESLGLGLEAQYGFTDLIRGDGSWSYFFQKKGVSMHEFNANLHYLVDLGVNDKLLVYPLAGLNYSITKVQSSTNGELGINVGGGFQYALTNEYSLKGEVKYVIGDADQVVLSIGVIYHF